MSKDYKKSFDFPKNWLRGGGISGKNIGILTPGYGLEKVSYGLKPTDYYYKKINRVPFQKIIKHDTVLTQCPYIVSAGIDLVHTFNMIPINKDFIVSFENELPRFLNKNREKYYNFAFEILASNRCKGIFGLSDISVRLAKQRVKKFGFNELIEKIDTFRGGIHVPDVEDDLEGRKKTTGPIQVCLVGKFLAHKGIEGTIKGLKKLRDGGVEIEFMIVGHTDDQLQPNPQYYIDRKRLDNIIEQENWITHYTELPNSTVIELFKNSHVMVMPSIDESLGWVMVEAGLCGTARIGTCTFAMPELINHTVDGWMVDIEVGDDGRWVHLGKKTAEEHWALVQNNISEGIINFLGASDMSPEKLIHMGDNAKKAMERLYSVDNARNDLEAIYNRALL